MGSAITSAIISISIGVVIVTGGNKVINREPATVSTEVTSSMQGVVHGNKEEVDFWKRWLKEEKPQESEEV